MALREWIRIVICAAVGFVIGLIAGIRNDTWYLALIGRFYAIGTFYGIKLIFTMLGGVGKTAGRSAFSSIAGGNWIGLLIIVVILILSTSLILLFGWILGLFVSGKALFDAYRTDSEIGGSADNSSDSGWDSNGGKPERRLKTKKKSEEDYENMSW